MDAQYIELCAKIGIGLLAAVGETYLRGHRLLLTDAKRIFGNILSFLLWLPTSKLCIVGLIALVRMHIPPHFGLFGLVNLPYWASLILGILILDICNYGVHRMEHAVPLLWRFHSVHHSDQFLDPSTYLRKHPLCALYFSSIFFAVLLGFGIPVTVALIYNIVADLVGLFAHSSLDFPSAVNKTLQKLRIIAPHDHRLHHSNWNLETDSNYGQIFSLWDQIFRTYRTRTDWSTLQYGLKDNKENTHAFPKFLGTPFHATVQTKYDRSA